MPRLGQRPRPEVRHRPRHARGATALHRHVAEIDNLRVAVAYAVATGSTEAAYRIVADSSEGVVGHPSFEVLDWIDPIGAPGPWTGARSDAIALVGILGVLAGDTEAMARAVAAIRPEHRPLWRVSRWLIIERAFVGDAASIETLLAQAAPLTSEHDRLTHETLSLYIPIIRLFENSIVEPPRCRLSTSYCYVARSHSDLA